MNIELTDLHTKPIYYSNNRYSTYLPTEDGRLVCGKREGKISTSVY